MMVTCACCWGCYRYSPHDVFKASPQPNLQCPHWKAKDKADRIANGEQRPEKEANGAVIVAATLTAAMLLRDELRNQEIKPVPKVISKIDTAARLAVMVAKHIKRR